MPRSCLVQGRCNPSVLEVIRRPGEGVERQKEALARKRPGSVCPHRPGCSGSCPRWTRAPCPCATSGACTLVHVEEAPQQQAGGLSLGTQPLCVAQG